MKVTYIFSPEETAHAKAYFAAWRSARSRVPRIQELLPRIGGICLAFAVSAVIFGISGRWHRLENPDWYFYTELLGLAAVVVVVVGYLFAQSRIARYMIGAEPSLGPESTASIGADGIVSTYAGRHSGTIWRRVSVIEEDALFLYAICDEWEAYFIPRNGFSSQSEYVAFREEVERQFRASRS